MGREGGGWRDWLKGERGRKVERWAERGEREEGGETGLEGGRLRDELRVDR